MSDPKKRYIIRTNIPFGEGAQGPQGPQGPPGSGASLPISSDDVEYNGDILTDVLDELLYIALTINSFAASPTTFEKGTVLVNASFSWTYNKAVESQSISGTNVVSPALLVGDRNKVVILNNIATDTVVTLTADDETSDGNVAKTRTTTLQFLNKVYWGIAVTGVINSAFVLALTNSELRGNRLKSFTVAPGPSQYIWFAAPVAYGAASFKTNGFNGGLSLEAMISFTNASGHTENYNVYRSTNANLGTTFVEVI